MFRYQNDQCDFQKLQCPPEGKFQRAKMADDQRKAMREADKERKAKRRAAMTKEEKSAVKEKDGLTRQVYDETIVQKKCQGIQFRGRDSENSELPHPEKLQGQDEH